MKNFDDFRQSLIADGDKVQNEIMEKFKASFSDLSFDDPIDEHNFKQQSLIDQSILVILEKYHEWLNS